jgi:putative Mg2+ transporter-C (MgtC) family protein
MDILPFVSFCLHAAAAALMGTAVGLERQWGQHTAGLRTNALVAFGACLFVSLPRLLGSSYTPAQLAGQIVVGVGFLGGGVILREGFNVRGINTAATVWCSAAVGALTGAGLPLEALAGMVGILAVNMGLRPVSEWLDRRLRHAKNVATVYRLRATCRTGREGVVRDALFRFFHEHPTMVLQGVATQEGAGTDRSCVVADIYSEKRDDVAIEDLMAQVNADPCVSAVSWEKNPSA